MYQYKVTVRACLSYVLFSDHVFSCIALMYHHCYGTRHVPPFPPFAPPTSRPVGLAAVPFLRLKYNPGYGLFAVGS